MTTDDPQSQAERRRILREQASTLLDHARAAAADEAGGRFARIQPQSVIGSTPVPQYPQAGTPFQSDPCGLEPPLGYDINAMPELASPTGIAVSPVATDDPAHAPSSGSLVQQPYGGVVSERAGSSSSSEEQTNE
jgi:hypothetical protein